jgi:hypothetical protein
MGKCPAGTNIFRFFVRLNEEKWAKSRKKADIFLKIGLQNLQSGVIIPL